MATTKTPKPFPFTADEMRAQLPMKARILDEEMDDHGITFRGRIRLPESDTGSVVVWMPHDAVLIPIDEWKEMIAWVAKQEKEQPA